MTVDRIRARTAKRTEVMERIRDRINLEHKDLLILVISLDKCMRCGKQEHQKGQRCPAKNAKCKACHKIGHFHKVCQSKKRAT